jgi:hypothetical protein
MNRPCDTCGTTYAAKTSRSRYCSARCRRRAAYTGQAARRRVTQRSVLADPQASTVAAAVLSVLEPHGLTGTPRGRAAMVLAERLDAADSESGAGLAALARQLDAMVDAALASVPTIEAVDPIDVLRARRRSVLAERAAS